MLLGKLGILVFGLTLILRSRSLCDNDLRSWVLWEELGMRTGGGGGGGVAWARCEADSLC